jgi:hypothetical protein
LMPKSKECFSISLQAHNTSGCRCCYSRQIDCRNRRHKPF